MKDAEQCSLKKKEGGKKGEKSLGRVGGRKGGRYDMVEKELKGRGELMKGSRSQQSEVI